MLDCRRCNHWVDENLARLIEKSRNGHAAESVFYQCKIYGYSEAFRLAECPRYEESSELFAVCSSCGIAVPKVCISLGECVNCTDTDLFCVDTCRGEGEKRFCTHYQRLLREGHTLVEGQECYEVFPETQGKAYAKADLQTPILAILPEKKTGNRE